VRASQRISQLVSEGETHHEEATGKALSILCFYFHYFTKRHSEIHNYFGKNTPNNFISFELELSHRILISF
jgi:hypothetical protein